MVCLLCQLVWGTSWIDRIWCNAEVFFVRNGIDWFKSHGKWQETGGIPSAGSLVFFDWNGDGISDHVGIVEKYEGGIIYTVEGNTGTNIGGNNVRGVWKHSYSVGSATILGYGII